MSPLSRTRGRARVGAVALVAVVALLSAGKAEAAGQILALELSGRDVDRVSRAGTTEPDGYTDVHFRVKVEGRPSASGPWSTE